VGVADGVLVTVGVEVGEGGTEVADGKEVAIKEIGSAVAFDV
jgi:hypothetical protein